MTRNNKPTTHAFVNAYNAASHEKKKEISVKI